MATRTIPEDAGEVEQALRERHGLLALVRAIRALLRGLRDDPLARSLPLDYDSRLGNLGDLPQRLLRRVPDDAPGWYRIVFAAAAG